MGIFNYNGPIMQTINKLVDCFFLSLLWILFSLPIVTCGAATTALYYTVHKVIRYDRSHVWREFWKSFKENFKQSTIVWVISLVIFYVLSVDFLFVYNLISAGKIGVWVYIPFALATVFMIIYITYIFGYIARFENSLKNILKNSAYFSIRHLLRSILLLGTFAVAVAFLFFFPIAIALLPPLYMYVVSAILESVFKKYMSEEDLAMEEERNRVYYN